MTWEDKDALDAHLKAIRSIKTEARSAASKENGKKGGRPVTTGAGLKRKRKKKGEKR